MFAVTSSLRFCPRTVARAQRWTMLAYMDIASRIARALGDESLVDKLGALQPNELASLLMAVMRKQAEREFVDVQRHFARAALVQPSSVDARKFHAIDAKLFAAAQDFEAIELSPLQPLGTSRCTGIDQNNVLSTTRDAEVIADPTSSLGQICTERRRRDRTKPVHLCASMRVVRMQPIPKGSNFSPHFRLFALVSAGRGDAFARDAMIAQCSAWLTFLADKNVRLMISDTRVTEAILAERGISRDVVRERVRTMNPATTKAFLEEHNLQSPVPGLAPGSADDVADALRERFPNASITCDPLRLAGLGYYKGLRLKLDVQAPNGDWLNLGDGGVVDWPSHALGDRKEILVTSGAGTELYAKIF
jgi:hypothetical protein